MGRLAVAEEGLVVDPRLQALEVEPARGLGRRQPARRTGRCFALVLVRPVALVAVAALAFAIFRAGMAVGILVATIVIAIERHLVEARVVIGIPSMSGLPELVRAIVGVAVVSVGPRASSRARDASLLSGVYCIKKARIRTIVYL